MIRVLLADDQELVRAGFRLILDLEPDIDVVGEAGDGAQCLRLLAETRPDVVLMDVRMPHMDGIEATKRLTAASGRAGEGASQGPKVLILTTFDLDAYVYEAMRAGASGFLLKDVPRDQLIAGVRVVARGEALLAPAVTRRLVERFVHLPSPGGGVPKALRGLSAREQEVLRLVARGLSNAEIASRLVLGEATVKTHVARILSKLGLRDRVQAVVMAYETGFLQPGADPPT
jgi:DNA-binding NarL/FixJ family response regulator